LRCRRYDGTANVPAGGKKRINPMLDALRRGVANLFVKILLGLLLISFVLLFGLSGDYLTRGPTASNVLVTVGPTQISVDTYRQALNEEVQAIARKLGHALTPEQAQLYGVPPRALARLIGSTAIDLHAKELGVTVADPIVAGMIKADPTFHGPNGEFSRNQFRQELVRRGYRSEEEYIQASRRDLQREQLTETLGAGVTPQQFMVDALHGFRNETRVIEHITPDFAKLVTVPEPSQEKLKAYFDENQHQFVALEERKANLLMLPRDAALARVKIGDDEIKAAYDAEKDTFNIPEKRRIQQLTFADKAAAEKAYAELSKARNFEETAAKLGFPAADIDLGVLTRAEMIDPKIAEAAFKMKKDELSRPVEGQFSTVLLRVPEIAPGKQRAFNDVKGEIRERIAADRVGQQLQSLHEKIEAGRQKGTPLKELAKELGLPYQEIAGVNRIGKTDDGKPVIAHADAGTIIEAFFAAAPGVETDPIELSDGGVAWFDLLEVVPEHQRPFEEVAAQVRTNFIESERRKEMASLVAKQVESLKPGEGLERIAKALGAKVERTPPVKRIAIPPPQGLSAVALQQAFTLPKGGVASAPTPDGKSRTVFRVADIVAARDATDEEAEALKADLARQMRVDVLDQYVSGLRTRYGITVNEKLVAEALGVQAQPGTSFTDN
jgi:peptidyl-prolyl cis-trans isomerase D